MKMKKVLGVALACATVFTLSACGGKKKAESDHHVIWVNRGPDVREMALVNEEMSKYTKEKIGETVELINFGAAQYVEKVQMMVASGERIDLCFSAASNNFNTNVSKGFYIDMGPYFEEFGKDIKATYPDYVYTSGIVNGTMYALPAWKDFAQERVVQYNLKTMDELSAATGIKPEDIKELKDLEPLLAEFKKRYPNGFPVSIKPTYNFFYNLGYIPVGDYSAIGALNIYKTDGKVVNPYEQEDAKEFLYMMHDWYKKGYMPSDVATQGENSATGKGFISCTEVLPYQRYVSNLKLAPEKQAGDLKLWEPRMISTAGSMQSIPVTSKNPAGAMKFLNILNTDKYLRNLVGLGIEGKHWEKVSEDDDFHFRYMDGKTRDEMGYYSWPYTQGNVYITMQVEGTPDDLYEKYKEFDDRALRSQQFGFVFDGESLKAELAALGTVYNEYITGLEVGARDPQVYLPQALDKMKAAGVEKVIAEMQRQFDAWKATQK